MCVFVCVYVYACVELPIMLHDQQQQQAPQMQVWVFQCAFLCVYVYACVELPIMLHDQQ